MTRKGQERRTRRGNVTFGSATGFTNVKEHRTRVEKVNDVVSQDVGFLTYARIPIILKGKGIGKSSICFKHKCLLEILMNWGIGIRHPENRGRGIPSLEGF